MPSEETIEKMRAAAKKRWENPEERLRMSVIRTGTRHTQETIEKIRASKMGLTPNEQGKNDPSPYTPGFTEALKASIRERDGYLCANCGRTQAEELVIHNRRLSVHHIDWSFDQHTRLNLISLCSECHLEVHTCDIEVYFEQLSSDALFAEQLWNAFLGR